MLIQDKSPIDTFSLMLRLSVGSINSLSASLNKAIPLILAGLAAQDETWVQRIYHLDRGYDKFDSKLQSLGAEVERLSEDSLPKSFTPYFDSI